MTSKAQRIIELQKHLVDTLEDITRRAEEISADRCPYRSSADVCTFTHGCRNQSRSGDVHYCSGAPLNSAPANAP